MRIVKLEFKKKPTRNKTLSIRITEDTLKRLQSLKKQYGVSFGDLMEKLVAMVSEK